MSWGGGLGPRWRQLEVEQADRIQLDKFQHSRRTTIVTLMMWEW